MKKLNRRVYAAAGVLALLIAGVIYSGSVLSRSIAASRQGWTSAQLSLTFTLVHWSSLSSALAVSSPVFIPRKFNPKSLFSSQLLILAIRSGNYAMVVIGFLVGGFAYGGVPAVQFPIINDFFGHTNYALNFSLLCTNLLVGSFASTIAGKLYDSTQLYTSTVLMMLICTVISFVLFLFIRRPSVKD